MNKKMNWLKAAAAGGVALSAVAGAVTADSVTTTNGGSVAGTTASGVNSLEVKQNTGKLYLWSGGSESSYGAKDGGVILQGSPIRAVATNSFEVWNPTDWSNFNTGTGASLRPLFWVDTANLNAFFKGADLSISKNGTTGGNLTVEGTLTVNGSGGLVSGGSPVVTQASMKTLSKLEIGSTASAATNNFALGIGLTTIGAHTAFNTGSGNTTIGDYSFVAGANNHLTGDYSTIFGGSCSTSQGYSIAAGQGSATTGFAAVAIGSGAYATGNFAFASGRSATAVAQGSTAMGIYPIVPTGSGTTDVPQDTLYSLGNGTGSSDRSNAITTLKNGQTTLRNKYWVSTAPTAAVTTTGANDGKALVVEGNTELKGKVIISTPQGDISPGIYAP